MDVVDVFGCSVTVNSVRAVVGKNEHTKTAEVGSIGSVDEKNEVEWRNKVVSLCSIMSYLMSNPLTEMIIHYPESLYPPPSF